MTGGAFGPVRDDGGLGGAERIAAHCPTKGDAVSRPTSVTVVIPTYERAALLPRAIDSVRETAAAAGAPVRIFVIDNASKKDPRPALQDRYGSEVRVVINERNLGMTGNWNRCREVAEADAADAWLMLEDDNLLDIDYLPVALAALETNPSCAWFHSAVTEFDDHGNERTWRPWSATALHPTTGPVTADDEIGWAFNIQIKASALLVRRCEATRGLPRYHEPHYFAHDVSGLCGLALAGGGWYSERPLMRYYVNPVGATTSARSTPLLVLAEMLRALRHNVEALVAQRRIPDATWCQAASKAPIDRLMLSVTSLHGPLVGRLAEVRDLLTAVLSCRRGELQGRAGTLARWAGPLAWPIARLVGRQLTRLERDSRYRR